MEEPTVDSIARITLRPLGTPYPLGLLAFGTGMLLLTALEAHWIPPDQQKLVAALALGFCVPLELGSAIFAFLSRDTAAGTTIGLFGATWIADAIFFLSTPPGTHTVVMVFLWSAFAVAALVLAVPSLKSKPYFAVLLIAAAGRFFASAAKQADFEGPVDSIGTAFGLVLVALAAYGALALLLEDGHHKTVLPLFRKDDAKMAIDGNLHDQLKDLPREPGVRTQL